MRTDDSSTNYVHSRYIECPVTLGVSFAGVHILTASGAWIETEHFDVDRL